jgi:hypothetical protein
MALSLKLLMALVFSEERETRSDIPVKRARVARTGQHRGMHKEVKGRLDE